MQTNRASTRSQASSSGKKRKSNQPSPSGKTEYHDVKDASDICVNETDLDTGTSKLKKTR